MLIFDAFSDDKKSVTQRHEEARKKQFENEEFA